jgi:transcriptional regulator with XRE-family HTH domain
MPREPYDIDNLGAPQAEVAFRLRAVRKARGLSLREFAGFLSSDGSRVSHTAVMKYEHEELRITPGYLELVAKSTEVPYGWFLSGLGSDEVPELAPALASAGLEFLPAYLHRSVTSRLEGLADWCGIPPGPGLVEFYRGVGRLLTAHFQELHSYVRPLAELSERELSVYMAMQFATLRAVFRRFGKPVAESNSEEAHAGTASLVRDLPT